MEKYTLDMYCNQLAQQAIRHAVLAEQYEDARRNDGERRYKTYAVWERQSVRDLADRIIALRKAPETARKFICD